MQSENGCAQNSESRIYHSKHVAKTEGQLLSVRASGSIGKILTYQGRKGFRHTHKKATPYNPKTSAQIADRLLFANVVAGWQTLTDEQKQVYNALGPEYGNITGFNVYIKLNKDRAQYWTKFGEAKFGATKKYGGP